MVDEIGTIRFYNVDVDGFANSFFDGEPSSSFGTPRNSMSKTVVNLHGSGLRCSCGDRRCTGGWKSVRVIATGRRIRLAENGRYYISDEPRRTSGRQFRRRTRIESRRHIGTSTETSTFAVQLETRYTRVRYTAFGVSQLCRKRWFRAQVEFFIYYWFLFY